MCSSNNRGAVPSLPPRQGQEYWEFQLGMFLLFILVETIKHIEMQSMCFVHIHQVTLMSISNVM